MPQITEIQEILCIVREWLFRERMYINKSYSVVRPFPFVCVTINYATIANIKLIKIEILQNTRNCANKDLN